MAEMSKPALLPGDVPQYSLGVNRAELARAAREIDRYVDEGLGIDGMPLQRGQSPLTKRRPREEQPQKSRGGSDDVTLDEQRTSAISGRAWRAWDGQRQETRAEPGLAELAAEKERLLGDIRDLRATNAKLGDALKRMKTKNDQLEAENERLRIICRAVLESAIGEDWQEQLREVQANGIDHDDQQGDAGAPAGE